MLTKEECVGKFNANGIVWNFDLERDWCYYVANLSDDRKNAWISQTIYRKRNSSKPIFDKNYGSKVEEIWGDELDYI